MSALLPDLWPYLASAFAVVVGLFSFGAVQRRHGRRQEREKRDRATIKALKTAKETADEVHGMDDPTMRADLDQWMRDK